MIWTKLHYHLMMRMRNLDVQHTMKMTKKAAIPVECSARHTNITPCAAPPTTPQQQYIHNDVGLKRNHPNHPSIVICRFFVTHFFITPSSFDKKCQASNIQRFFLVYHSVSIAVLLLKLKFYILLTFC